MFTVVCMKPEWGYNKLAGPFMNRDEAESALKEWKDTVYECNDLHVVIDSLEETDVQSYSAN
jgi:hypothetical protein